MAFEPWRSDELGKRHKSLSHKGMSGCQNGPDLRGERGSAFNSRYPFETRSKPEEIITKLRQVDLLVSQGSNVADAIRSIGVTEVTYYLWRQECGGLKSDQAKRMKDLETENNRLRKAIADLTLDKLILQEASRGNF